MRAIALRLYPDQDLRTCLLTYAREHQIAAATVLSGIGSLKQASIRFADQEAPTRLQGRFEVLSLQGTLSSQGIHLHMAIADAQGQVLGGHVSDGCIIYTTGEIIVGILDDLIFGREPDPQTGFRELQIQEKTS